MDCLLSNNIKNEYKSSDGKITENYDDNSIISFDISQKTIENMYEYINDANMQKMIGAITINGQLLKDTRDKTISGLSNLFILWAYGITEYNLGDEDFAVESENFMIENKNRSDNEGYNFKMRTRNNRIPDEEYFDDN